LSVQRITFELQDGVAEVRQICPQRRNAIDPPWVTEFADAVAACEAPEVRAVLLTADGPAFTVGGDLEHFTRERDRLGDELEAMVRPFHAALGRLGALEVPVVAAAQGAIAGGGLGLLHCADLVVLADDAKIATGFARIGLSGDGGSTWALPRLVGLRRAQQLTLGGRVLNAREALDWGLATEVVARGELQAAGAAHARRLAAGPTFALGRMRQLLRASSAATWQDQLAAELEAMTACGATTDAREGVTSFVERRDPAFRDGR